MKHDIIDRDTGNIVGVISLSSNDSYSQLLADINGAYALINRLQARLEALETDVVHLGANIVEMQK